MCIPDWILSGPVSDTTVGTTATFGSGAFLRGIGTEFFGVDSLSGCGIFPSEQPSSETF
jgi:hypothetical protein